MREIIKGDEPATLTEYRHAAYANYNDYPDKDTLRQALVNEQRGLCCYCLSRIRPYGNAMKIEHWHSQDVYPNEQLDYRNLLGACLGNQGQSPKHQHCDTLKGSRNFSRNPANPLHQIEHFIHYEGDGKIISHDPIFNDELNEVLNLNFKFLQNNRKATLNAFKAALDKRGDLSRITLERLVREWNGELHGGELQPFCQVVIYWLRKRLAHA